MYKRLILSGLMKTVSNYPIPNTFRMKVKCALYVEIESEEELESLDFDALPQPLMVMGGGSNLLFTKDFPGTVLNYGFLPRLARKVLRLWTWSRAHLDEVHFQVVDLVQAVCLRTPQKPQWMDLVQGV